MGIGLLVIVVLFYILKGQMDFSPDSIIKGMIPKEGIQLENIHFTQDSPDDRMKWILDARNARFSEDRNFISFKDFRIRLKSEKKPFMELTGRSGDYNKSAGSLNLQGDLRGDTEDGYSVKTDHLLYEHGEGILKSDKHVQITGPFFSLEGVGIFFNLEKETLTIKAKVTAVINKEGFTL